MSIKQCFTAVSIVCIVTSIVFLAYQKSEPIFSLAVEEKDGNRNAFMWNTTIEISEKSEPIFSLAVEEKDGSRNAFMWNTTIEMSGDTKMIQLWNSIQMQHANVKRQKRVPDIIGIGIKKCGTGALIHFLRQHPLIKTPQRPETFFFITNYEQGLDYYRSIMPPVAEDELVMEKTPKYFFTETALKRIAKDLPHAKLILVLCEPVTRVYSDFVHVHYLAYQSNDTYFAEAFHADAKRFVSEFSGLTTYSEVAEKALQAGEERSFVRPFAQSIYHHNMKLWREVFNKSRLLVLNGDLWLTDPGLLIERVEKFLDIPKLLMKKDFRKSPDSDFYCLNRWWNASYHSNNEVTMKVNGEELLCMAKAKGRTRNGVRSMRPDTREMLRKFYKPHNLMLYDILGENFGW